MIDIFERIRESEASGNLATFFPNLTNEVPTWNDFLNHLDTVSKREVDATRAAGLNPDFEFTTGGVIRKGEYYSMSQTLASDVVDFFSTLMPFEKQIAANQGGDESRYYMADAFISFITDDEYATPHTDKYTDNFFVGCQGEVQWNIYQNWDDPEPAEVYVLKSGDAIFVRGDVLHEVKVLTPRASIVFRLDVDR